MPSRSSSRATISAVRCSSKPSSGCACRSRRIAVSSIIWLRTYSIGVMSLGKGDSLHAEARNDWVIEEVDDAMYEHEDERCEAEIRRDDRHVGEAHRLDEQESHPRPLEHGLRD